MCIQRYYDISNRVFFSAVRFIHHTSYFVFCTVPDMEQTGFIHTSYIHILYIYVHSTVLVPWYSTVLRVSCYSWVISLINTRYLVRCTSNLYGTGHKHIYNICTSIQWCHHDIQRYTTSIHTSYLVLGTEQTWYISYMYSTVLSLFNGATLASYIVFVPDIEHTGYSRDILFNGTIMLPNGTITVFKGTIHTLYFVRNKQGTHKMCIQRYYHDYSTVLS